MEDGRRFARQSQSEKRVRFMIGTEADRGGSECGSESQSLCTACRNTLSSAFMSLTESHLHEGSLTICVEEPAPGIRLK